MNDQLRLNNHLTWEELANLYKDRTGQSARIRPMGSIFDWAKNQPDIQETEDGYLILVKATRYSEGMQL